jgi:hypothetical protein
VFPWFGGVGFAQEVTGFLVPGTGGQRQDGGLPTVEEAVPDAAVPLRLVYRVGPAALLAQGAQAVGEEDGPQPPGDCLAGAAGGDERGDADGLAVDGGVASGGPRGLVEGLQDLEAAVAWRRSGLV